MVKAIRSDKPFEEMEGIRADLVTMALLADHYVALVESEDSSGWGVCTDGASPKGVHESTERCLYCGLTR
jgi:hypothetical protein